MEVSMKAKERFCKDCNIPIKIFQEPYFTDRLKLYNPFYNTLEKWDRFVKWLNQYNCEQDYFEEYNKVKDNAISFIKESEAYNLFNTYDFNKFEIKNKGLPSDAVFKPSNDGKTFISIDMRKANFSSLKHFGDTIGKSMFDNCYSWESFMYLFTLNEHIIESKYIRQVILGNCNPRRHITYEKYLMDQVVSLLDEKFDGITDVDKIVSFTNDEIIYEVNSKIYSYFSLEIVSYIKKILSDNIRIPFTVEPFTLYKINGIDGYYKIINLEQDKQLIQPKCVDNYMMPFVLRAFLREPVTESDKIFFHEGLLSKFIEVPEIKLELKGVN